MTQRKTERSVDAPPATVPLPEAPVTASPVPWLTSIHGTPGRGDYGNASYRGNCSGLLIRDLLRFYQPRRVLDPMEGGGTCRDVCRELGVSYVGRDLKTGFDATDARAFGKLGTFDFIWTHPPYWQMVRYNPGDSRCLSSGGSVGEFVRQMRAVFANCRRALNPGGKLAVLMGDGKHEGEYLGLPFRLMSAATKEGFLVISTESRSTSPPHPRPLVAQSPYRRYFPAVGGSDAYRGRLRRHPPVAP